MAIRIPFGAVLLLFLVMPFKASPALAAGGDFAWNVPVYGAIVGQSAGAVVDYRFVGDGTVVTVILRYGGGNPAIDPRVGFIVYNDWSAVVNQTESGGANGATISSFQTLPSVNYDVQVYNYEPGFSMNYSLLLSDPFQVLTPSPTTPQVTPVPTDSGNPRKLARGQTVQRDAMGQSSGTAHDYLLVGDGQPLSLVLTDRPRDPILDGAVGYVVYDQWGNVQQNLLMRNSASPSGALLWTFTPLPGVSYDIQVFTYQPNVTITYTLTAL